MTAGRTINSQSKDWGTPHKYVDAVKVVMGGQIDFDPCSNDYSIVNARTELKLPKDDGLAHCWNYKTIYVNPPYGRVKERKTSIKNWLHKCHEAFVKYGSEVIALVPVATNTAHWKQYVFGKATAICFLYDTRLRFLENGEDIGKGAPMSCSIIYWGNNYALFEKVFSQYGAVIDGKYIKSSNQKHKNSSVDLFESPELK